MLVSDTRSKKGWRIQSTSLFYFRIERKPALFIPDELSAL
jgi:hypothetical protein